MAEVNKYLSTERIECLLCGREFKNLSIHLAMSHNTTPDEYRKEFGIPYSRSLTCRELHILLSEIQGKHLRKYKHDHEEEMGGYFKLLRTAPRKKQCPAVKAIKAKQLESIRPDPRLMTQETKDKISLAHKGKDTWNKGKTGIYSKESLQKMSNSRKKNRENPEYRQHMSAIHKGKPNKYKGVKGRYTEKVLHKMKNGARKRYADKAIIYKGKAYTKQDVADIAGVSRVAIRQRIKSGWSVERLFESRQS